MASNTLFGAPLKQAKDDVAQRVSEADEAGEKFVQLFYETMDKRRQLLSGFYFDGSVVVWNGNDRTGAVSIANFYQSFPGSEHVILSLDCQPVADSQGQRTVLVACEGQVKYDGKQQEVPFAQHFLLTKQGEVWKVASDCFRFLDQL